MSGQELVTRWQRRVDREFPRGLIMRWTGQDEPVYQVPWLQVTGAAGLDPVVTWLVHGVAKRFGPARVLSYAEVQREPCLVVRVALEGVDLSMDWSAGVSDSLAAQMAADRAQAQADAVSGAWS